MGKNGVCERGIVDFLIFSTSTFPELFRSAIYGQSEGTNEC